MARLFIYILLFAVAAAGILFLSQQPGSVSFNLFGFEGSMNLAVTVLVLALLGGVIALIWGLFTGLIRLPGKVGKSRERSKINKANQALADGLLAAEAGDIDAATRLSKKASKHAADERLKLLLEARAAEANDDWAGAERAWGQLTRLPGGQLAGLRGAATAAAERGDKFTAEIRAREALALKSNADWPFNSLFDMQVANGDWSKALETLSIGDKRGLITGENLRRRRAVLLTARAVSLPAGQGDDAQKALAEAMRLSPAFSPAAWHSARRLITDGKDKAALSLLITAWKARPHPALSQLVRNMPTRASGSAHKANLSGLISANTSHRESRILSAEMAMDAGDWPSAIKTLALLVEENPTARLCLLMERALKGYDNKEDAALWARMATSASREPDWSDLDPKGGAFDYDPRDWARLVYTFGDVGDLVHPRYESFGRELEAGRAPALPAPDNAKRLTTPDALNGPLTPPLDYVPEDD